MERITETDIDWQAEIAEADEIAEHHRSEEAAEAAARTFFCIRKGAE